MASRFLKFRPRVVVSSVAVFIILSVSSAEERTRCYWCGPLAEQVHRSQRAPSCDIFTLEQHETLCDQGYTHCAIIAASPPYAESRLCVKFYQDECYSLYCNSTKTWRMVCACRGDLCNGPRTARETQAFALLPKFVKTKPRKRNLVSHFIGIKTRTPTDDDAIIIISKENETIYGIQSDQPIHSKENTSNLYTPTPTHADDNIIIVHGTLNNDEKIINHDHDRNHSTSNAENDVEKKIQSMETTMSAAEDTHLENAKVDEEPAKADTDKHLSNVDKNLVNSEVDKHIDNAQAGMPLNSPEIGKHLGNPEADKHLNNTEKNSTDNTDEDKHHDNAGVDKNLVKSEADKLASAGMSNPTTVVAEIVNENHDSTIAVTTSTKQTVEIAVAVQSSATPGKLPPAEALQQNVTPTKAMELTTMGTVAMSTENHIIETTTQPTEANNLNKKNSGAQNLAHFIMSIICFLVHLCI